jgi:hypothetical protein
LSDPESGASTSAAATRVDVDFVLAKREPMAAGLLASAVSVGVHELPAVGPFALLTAVIACGVVGAPIAFLRAGPLYEFGVALVLVLLLPAFVAAAACFSLMLTFAFARFDARARGAVARVTFASFMRAVRALPTTYGAVALFAIASVFPLVLGELGMSHGPMIALAMGAAVVALCARLLPSLVYIVVDEMELVAAIARSWRTTEPHTARFIAATALVVLCSGVGAFAIWRTVTYCAFAAGAVGFVGMAASFIAVVGVILPLDVAFVYALYARSRA